MNIELKDVMTDEEVKQLLEKVTIERDRKYESLLDARHQYDEQVMYGTVIGLRSYNIKCRAALMEAECMWLRAQDDVDEVRYFIINRRAKEHKEAKQ